MRILAIALASLLMVGCAHAPSAPTAATGGLAARDVSTTVTPDQALGKARQKATAWQADARLVSVAWGVAKFQTTSIVFHLFHSPKAGKLFLVESKLVSFWQKTREISDKKFTLPALTLGTLGEYPVSAEDALATAKKHLGPDQQRPLAVLALVKPARVLPGVWVMQADTHKCLVHAKSGKVLAHLNWDIPALPFM